jgi:phage N-6-adenine-methyltransferase
MLNKGIFTSDHDSWETPNYIFDDLHRVFNFTLDVCANDYNHKLNNYYSEEINGLKQDWQGVCYMNPPYGRAIDKWIKKAYNESLKGTKIVALIPARTDTKWFQYCWNADYLYFIKGRVKFLKNNKEIGAATFPSVIVVWNHKEKFNLSFAGQLVKLSE